jgi:hypothetical protein
VSFLAHAQQGLTLALAPAVPPARDVGDARAQRAADQDQCGADSERAEDQSGDRQIDR